MPGNGDGTQAEYAEQTVRALVGNDPTESAVRSGAIVLVVDDDAEIRDVVRLREDGMAPCSHVSSLLDVKASAVARQIDDLQVLLAELHRLRHRARRFDPAKCDPQRVCDVLSPSH